MTDERAGDAAADRTVVVALPRWAVVAVVVVVAWRITVRMRRRGASTTAAAGTATVTD